VAAKEKNAEAWRPRLLQLEREGAAAQRGIEEVRMSLDLVAGMHGRATAALQSRDEKLSAVTTERDSVARKLFAQIRKVRLLEDELKRQEAINARVMAAHQSAVESYREQKSRVAELQDTVNRLSGASGGKTG